MNKKTFLARMLHEVNLKLPAGHTAHYKEVQKNNGVPYTGMYLSVYECETMSPLLYMEPIFAKCRTEDDLERFADQIVTILMTSHPQSDEVSKILDPSYARTHVVFRLVNFERNELMLRDVVYRRCLDLAVAYAIYIKSESFGSGMTMVTESLMRDWKLTEGDLYRLALENSPLLLPEKWLNLGEAVGNPNGPHTPADDFSVLSNDESFYGASVLLYSNGLKKAADEWADDLLILPTSVHEVIVVPERHQKLDVLLQVFRELQQSETQPENLLSDAIYRYFRETGELGVAGRLSPAPAPVPLRRETSDPRAFD